MDNEFNSTEYLVLNFILNVFDDIAFEYENYSIN